MKNALLIVLVLLVGASMLFGQVYQDDLLIIPKTQVAPIIDGEVDSTVWRYVAETLMVIPDNADAAEPDDWFDLFGSLKALWDDTNLYIFIEVQDDILNTGADYNYDGVELYFDGDNSKGETYDGINDLQLRFNLGEDMPDDIDTGGATAIFDKATCDYVVLETDFGWNLEVAIPWEQMELEPDLDFGFDAQINDADESTRENMYRWWSDDNNEWQNASLFGNAMLSTQYVIDGEFLPIPQAAVIPTIDGAMAEGEWIDAWQITDQRLDNTEDIYEHVYDWTECRNFGWLKWGEGKLFYYLQVYDDYLDYAETESDNWEYDSIEIFFDGDNSKGEVYDGIDDVQLRLNLGQSGAESVDTGYGNGVPDWGFDKASIEYVVMETDLGWDVEAAFDLDALMIDAAIGVDFGLEFQLNDCDNPDETPNRTCYRWWAAGEPTWSNASLFGSAMLTKAIIDAVESEATPVNNFALAQNYPNPFNPSTTISYSLAKVDRVELTVYNMLGEKVATLVNEVQPAGTYNAVFDAAGLPSGVYLYTLTTSNSKLSNKMMLVK